MQSSHELVNVQYLTGQSFPAASRHFPTAISCQVLLPISEAKLRSLPPHSVSFGFMANLLQLSNFHLIPVGINSY